MLRAALNFAAGVIVIGAGTYWAYNQANTISEVAAKKLGVSVVQDPLSIETSPSSSMSALPPKTPAAVAPQKNFRGQDQVAYLALMAKFNTGDYFGALALADQAVADHHLSSEFHAWLRLQLPAILASAGWLKIKLGDCDEASRLLMRSDALRRTIESTKGLAFCNQKLNNTAAADEFFQAYLELQPDDLEMQVLYTDSLESQGRFSEAVKILDDVVTEGTGDMQKEASRRLKAMRGRANESHNQATESSRHFVVTFRPSDHEDIIGFVMETLEQAVDEFQDDYAFRDPIGQFEVILYPTDAFRGAVAGGPEWAVGVFDGRLRIPVRQRTTANAAKIDESLRNVLRHELVHALNSQMTGRRPLPPWFEEGLAQRLACGRTGCGPTQFPPTPGDFLATANFDAPYIALSADAAGQAYRQSLYLVRTIESMRGREEGLRGIIRNLNVSGDLSSEAILRPINLNFEQVRTQAALFWKQKNSF